jgi:hypothetical protein
MVKLGWFSNLAYFTQLFNIHLYYIHLGYVHLGYIHLGFIHLGYIRSARLYKHPFNKLDRLAQLGVNNWVLLIWLSYLSIHHFLRHTHTLSFFVTKLSLHFMVVK